MAAWTHSPASLVNLSVNELDVVFAEVIRAIQRRETNLQYPRSTYTPSVAYPASASDCQGAVIPWRYNAAPNSWLATIQNAIDDMLSRPAPYPHESPEWEPASPPGGGTKVVFDFVDSGGTAYTEATLHNAAFGSNDWTTLIGLPRLRGIRTGLYEAMKCLELMKRVIFIIEIDCPYIELQNCVWSYNAVGQANADAAYAAIDTQTTDFGDLPLASGPVNPPRYSCGHMVYQDASGSPWTDDFRYVIMHGAFRFGSEFDTKMDFFELGNTPSPDLRGTAVQYTNVLDSADDTAISLYSEGDWEPTLTAGDYPFTGGAFEDHHTIKDSDPGEQAVTLDLDGGDLPDGGDAHFDFRCPVTQKLHKAGAGSGAAMFFGFFKDDDKTANSRVRFTYDLQSAYDPTG